MFHFSLESDLHEISNGSTTFSDRWRDASFSGILSHFFNRRNNDRHLRSRDRQGFSHTNPFVNLLPGLRDHDEME